MPKEIVLARQLWKDQILADPSIHHGEPCIRGTRVPVATVLGSLADGMSAEEVLQEYPQLSPEDVRAALEEERKTRSSGEVCSRRSGFS